MEFVVYSITCKSTNKKYFGRSQEVEKRWRSHRNMLRKGNHSNLLLQEEWSKYNESDFVFEVLHAFDNPESAERKEQEYIDNPNYKKYNISDSKIGGDTFTNNPRSDSTRLLKSINSSGKNNPMYGKPKNDYTIQRIKESNSKSISIEGERYMSLTEASKKLNMGITTISYRLNSSSFTEWKYA